MSSTRLRNTDTQLTDKPHTAIPEAIWAQAPSRDEGPRIFRVDVHNKVRRFSLALSSGTGTDIHPRWTAVFDRSEKHCHALITRIIEFDQKERLISFAPAERVNALRLRDTSRNSSLAGQLRQRRQANLTVVWLPQNPHCYPSLGYYFEFPGTPSALQPTFISIHSTAPPA